ncbi:MAG: copper amine oxidase N-terminal domain-containing protein [Armatimonadota bacterium]
MNTYTRILAAALLMALAISVSAAPIVIPRDAVIPVTLDKALGSASSQAGNVFYVHQSGINGEGFPDRTQFTGNVVSVTKASGKTVGQIGVSFVSAKLPNGLRVPIVGRLMSLDETSTKTDPATGRLMGTTTGGNNDLKFVAIGGGAGALIGQLTTKRPLTGTLIGAAAGYLYARTQAKAAVGKNVHIDAGTRFGIILDQDVTVPGSTATALVASTEDVPDYYSGQQVVFNSLQPVMSGNELMLPFRSVMNSLDMPFDYNSATRTVNTTGVDQQVHYSVGSRYIYADGTPTKMSAASRMINGSVYVPASYIELLTDKTTDWDQQLGVLSLN